MAMNSTPQEALKWAAAAASLKMEAEGPFGRSKEEIEDLLERKYR
jgi:sugar/nucleoside kinase (ribokinase family)